MLYFTEVLCFVPREDVVKALNAAIDKREEGLVVKSPSSVYKPNSRSGTYISRCSVVAKCQLPAKFTV